MEIKEIKEEGFSISRDNDPQAKITIVKSGSPERINRGLKRILRIIVGAPLSPFPMFLGTWVWLFSDGDESWGESVGYPTWCLASGDWDKLPE